MVGRRHSGLPVPPFSLTHPSLLLGRGDDCAVRKAVEEHYIAESRYQSYLSMLEDKEESKYREAF